MRSKLSLVVSLLALLAPLTASSYTLLEDGERKLSVEGRWRTPGVRVMSVLKETPAHVMAF